MSSENGARLPVKEVVERARGEMTPLNAQFSYFCVIPVAEEDLKQYLHDPISALPPAVVRLLPQTGVVLVPYLDRVNGRASEMVSFERPPDNRYAYSAMLAQDSGVMLVMAIKEEEVANYHYSLYHEIAGLVADRMSAEARGSYERMLREEFGAEAHGEVDERSWHLKQSLLRRQTNLRKETKGFRDYARQSFRDTMTLYLHGICCDIDVETGPRQLASRYLRKRLDLLYSIFPPPDGYPVFPEQLKQANKARIEERGS
jgi:hypothetical protein